METQDIIFLIAVIFAVLQGATIAFLYSKYSDAKEKYFALTRIYEDLQTVFWDFKDANTELLITTEQQIFKILDKSAVASKLKEQIREVTNTALGLDKFREENQIKRNAEHKAYQDARKELEGVDKVLTLLDNEETKECPGKTPQGCSLIGTCDKECELNLKVPNN